MFGILFILILAIIVVIYTPKIQTESEEEEDLTKKKNLKILWQITANAMKDRKPLLAEKALLTMLKIDERNASAYNRLGILYAKEKQYKHAIECFEIAQSLDYTASSLHNVGLIYLETGKYEKAAMAFDQAIKLEGDLPARYIAYAKAEEKLGHKQKAIDALESAFELDRSPSVLRHMLDLHAKSGDEAAAEKTKTRILNLLEEKRALLEAPRTTRKPRPAKVPRLRRRRA
jgi:tetratricopeptide (TPR) repeat protein